ncbi:hypothetical protein [Streptomyces sp. NPDC006463]|uniref:hypothetical protein n=1 Tax=Streptomyces sp. NPDC006463 TaxID=3364746 RepID=UPI0036884541
MLVLGPGPARAPGAGPVHRRPELRRQFLPAYGPAQIGFTAGFTPADIPVGYLLLGPAWFVAMWLLGTAAFFARTRNQLPAPAAAPPTGATA